MSKKFGELVRMEYSLPMYAKRALKRIADKKGVSMSEVLTTTMESVYRNEFTQEKQHSVRRVIPP